MTDYPRKLSRSSANSRISGTAAQPPSPARIRYEWLKADELERKQQVDDYVNLSIETERLRTMLLTARQQFALRKPYLEQEEVAMQLYQMNETLHKYRELSRKLKKMGDELEQTEIVGSKRLSLDGPSPLSVNHAGPNTTELDSAMKSENLDNDISTTVFLELKGILVFIIAANITTAATRTISRWLEIAGIPESASNSAADNLSHLEVTMNSHIVLIICSLWHCFPLMICEKWE